MKSKDKHGSSVIDYMFVSMFNTTLFPASIYFRFYDYLAYLSKQNLYDSLKTSVRKTHKYSTNTRKNQYIFYISVCSGNLP